jgi:hypothetical protein
MKKLVVHKQLSEFGKLAKQYYLTAKKRPPKTLSVLVMLWLNCKICKVLKKIGS